MTQLHKIQRRRWMESSEQHDIPQSNVEEECKTPLENITSNPQKIETSTPQTEQQNNSTQRHDPEYSLEGDCEIKKPEVVNRF